MTPEELKLIAKARRRRAEADEGLPDEPQPPAPQQAPLSPLEKIRGARSEIMNTAFFGQADPLVDAITGQPGQSKLGREEFRARASQSPSLLTRQLPPLMSSTGAVVNPPFMKFAAPWVRGSRNLGEKVFRGATTGGAQAGLQALGERQPAGEVKKRAGYGALGGGLTPLIFWGLEKIWKNTVGGLLKHIVPNSQEAHATKVVMDAVVADVKAKYPHMDEKEVWRYAEQRMDEMGPRGALIDMGPTSRGLGRQVYETPGQGSADIEQYLRPRFEGASDFSTAGSADALIEDLGKIIPEDYMSAKQESLRQEEARPHYDEAFAANQDMHSNELNLILREPDAKRAFRAAVKEMRAKGRNPVPYDKEATDQHIEGGGFGKMGIGIKMEVLNEVKIMLGKMEADSYVDDGFGGLKKGQRTETFGALRERLKNEMIKLDATGEYKIALGIAQEKIKQREALQRGTRALGGQDTAIEREESLSRLSEGEKKHYEIGFKRELQKKIEDTPFGGDPVKKVMKGITQRDKTEAAFTDYDKFLQWKKALERERDIAATYQEVLGGPKTSRGEAGREAMKTDPERTVRGLASIDIARPATWLTGPYQAVQGLGDKFSLLYNQSIQKRIVDMLTGQLPQRPYPQGGVAQPQLPQKLAEDLRSKQLMEAIIRGQSGYRF